MIVVLLALSAGFNQYIKHRTADGFFMVSMLVKIQINLRNMYANTFTENPNAMRGDVTNITYSIIFCLYYVFRVFHDSISLHLNFERLKSC